MYDHGMHVLVVLFPCWGGVGRYNLTIHRTALSGPVPLLYSFFFSDEHVRRSPIPYCLFPAQYIMDWVLGARPLYPPLY